MTDRYKTEKNPDMVNVVLGEGYVLAHSFEWADLERILIDLRSRGFTTSFIGQINAKLYGLDFSKP